MESIEKRLSKSLRESAELMDEWKNEMGDEFIEDRLMKGELDKMIAVLLDLSHSLSEEDFWEQSANEIKTLLDKSKARLEKLNEG